MNGCLILNEQASKQRNKQNEGSRENFERNLHSITSCATADKLTDKKNISNYQLIEESQND